MAEVIDLQICMHAMLLHREMPAFLLVGLSRLDEAQASWPPIGFVVLSPPPLRPAGPLPLILCYHSNLGPFSAPVVDLEGQNVLCRRSNPRI